MTVAALRTSPIGQRPIDGGARRRVKAIAGQGFQSCSSRGRPVPQELVVGLVVSAMVGFLGGNALVIEEDLHVVGRRQPQRVDAVYMLSEYALRPACPWRATTESCLCGLLNVSWRVVHVNHVALVLDRVVIARG
jgi:hypothetical protein